jgi:hypothetical protein
MQNKQIHPERTPGQCPDQNRDDIPEGRRDGVAARRQEAENRRQKTEASAWGRCNGRRQGIEHGKIQSRKMESGAGKTSDDSL